MFELKRLSPSAVPSALAKAERYRLLNEPEQAQSICEDILRIEPGNRAALVMLILALTDLLPRHDTAPVSRMFELAAQLPSDYERLYYQGLIAERRGRALLHRSSPGRTRPAGDLLRQAMDAFERAEQIKPPDNDDALLRWNAIARLLDARPELATLDEEVVTPVMLE